MLHLLTPLRLVNEWITLERVFSVHRIDRSNQVLNLSNNRTQYLKQIIFNGPTASNNNSSSNKPIMSLIHKICRINLIHTSHLLLIWSANWCLQWITIHKIVAVKGISTSFHSSSQLHHIQRTKASQPIMKCQATISWGWAQATRQLIAL